MARKVSIEVFDRLTGERRIESCTLPVEIGKQPEGASAITLSPTYQTISRRHGRLEQEGSDLFYLDTSSNGSSIAGLVLRGGRRRLAKGDVVQIENYNLRLINVEPVVVKHTSAALAELGEISMVPGETAVLVGTNGRLRMASADAAGGESVAARLTIENGTLRIDIDDPSLAATFTINRANVHATTGRARLFDVVGIGGARFEVLKPDHAKIVCGNPACHLLNDLPYEENCTWCGFYLAASGSFTRVTTE